MTKTLSDILQLSHTTLHSDPEWSKAGFGPTEYARAVRTAYNKPVDQTDYSGAANRDLVDYTAKKINDFFNLLGNYVMHDNQPQQSVFDATMLDKDGHRPADRLVGEAVEEMITLAYDVIEEAVVYEVGKLYEANVSFRGLQREVKVFFPNFKLASRRQLQEAVNKVFPGAVVLSYSVIDKNQRIEKTPLILAEDETDLNVVAIDNILFESTSGTFIVFDDTVPEVEYEYEDQLEEQDSPSTVDTIFDNYINKLRGQE